MKRHIEERWQALLTQAGKAIPKGESRKRMRAVFFAGASTMMSLIQNGMKDRDDSAFVDELFAEVDEFVGRKTEARR